MSRLTSVTAATLAAFAFAAPGLAGDFDGAYGGIGVGFGSDPINPTFDHSIDLFVGYNFAMGNGLVAGAESVANWNPDSIWGFDSFTGKVDGRVGYLVSDDFMVYGRLGGGYTTGGTGSAIWDLGAGAEFSLFDSIKLRGEVDRVDPFDAGMDSQVNGRLGVILDF